MASFNYASSTPWLLLLIGLTGVCHEVGGMPTPAVVTKARCYANCLTSLESVDRNLSKEACESSMCKKCLSPCAAYGTSLKDCKEKCKNSSICKESCQFIALAKNFTSPFAGDGSFTSKPEAPSVVGKSFQKISLKWPAIENASGTPVYFIGMKFSGDALLRDPIYFTEVYTSPSAVITIKSLCARVVTTPFRSTFKGIFYKFHVVAVTGNGSVSLGPETTNIELPKPDPVTNITVAKIEYDASSVGDKLKVAFSWRDPKGQEQIISKYAVFWKAVGPSCQFSALPRTKELENLQTLTPEKNGSIHLYQKMKQCLHQIEVYSMAQCIPSNATTLRYTYSGCRNISSFPRDICYEFDPPPTPAEDRMVRNLTLGPILSVADYTFTVNVSWSPPVYPYKEVTVYVSRWSERYFLPSGSARRDTSIVLSDLLPSTRYRFQVSPFFSGLLVASAPRLIIFTTPEPNASAVQVQNLTHGDLTASGQVDVFWQTPLFKRITVLEYIVQCKTLRNVAVLKQWNKVTTNTTYTVHNVVPGERTELEITPAFFVPTIKGKASTLVIWFPGPNKTEVQVQNLGAGKFIEETMENTFSVNFSWTKPSFKYGHVTTYNVSYWFAGYSRTDIPCKSGSLQLEQTRCYLNNMNRSVLTISGLLPRENVTVEVTPIFSNQGINGEMISQMASAPEPREDSVIVVNLKHSLPVPSLSNGHRVTVSWDKPLYKHSAVERYKYKLSVVAEKDAQKRRKKDLGVDSELITYNTSVTIDGISTNQDILFEVTPVFKASVVRGKEARLIILARPTQEAIVESTGPRAAVVSNFLVILLMLLLIAVR